MLQRRTLIALCVACFCLGGSTAHAATQSDTPRSLSVKAVQWNFLHEYGRVWQLLHPRYQRVTTRAFWESCKRKKAPAGVNVKSIKAIDSYPDTITLPLLGRVRVEAVAIELRYTVAGSTNVQSANDTIYWVRYGKGWKGLWALSDYQAYSHHRCPSN
jgi:hypothetical protein